MGHPFKSYITVKTNTTVPFDLNLMVQYIMFIHVQIQTKITPLSTKEREMGEAGESLSYMLYSEWSITIKKMLLFLFWVH
jgi:hypothetical protein